MTDRDPVEESAGDSEDLYDIVSWEERTFLDSLSVGVYNGLVAAVRLFFVFIASLILVVELGIALYVTFLRPAIGILTVLSVLPAFGLVAYIWYTDVTLREPVLKLGVTFLLGIVFASIAALLNSSLFPVFSVLPTVGLLLFFYLVVGPVEEAVKMLAVRVYAYNNGFDAVVDGVVYGAAAGLGFATIENLLYITNAFVATAQMTSIEQLQAIVAASSQRAFVGPGHVIFSCFAGYYLGLARYNPENAGPIAVKGLLIASFIHATYNTVVTYAPTQLLGRYSILWIIIAYDGIFGYLLYRKVKQYRSMYLNYAVE